MTGAPYLGLDIVEVVAQEGQDQARMRDAMIARQEVTLHPREIWGRAHQLVSRLDVIQRRGSAQRKLTASMNSRG